MLLTQLFSHLVRYPPRLCTAQHHGAVCIIESHIDRTKHKATDSLVGCSHSIDEEKHMDILRKEAHVSLLRILNN